MKDDEVVFRPRGVNVETSESGSLMQAMQISSGWRWHGKLLPKPVLGILSDLNSQASTFPFQRGRQCGC